MLRNFLQNLVVRWSEWRLRRAAKRDETDIISAMAQMQARPVDINARRRRQHEAAQRHRQRW